MSYQSFFEQTTGRVVPKDAEKLEPLFEQIATGSQLPPRSQQAIDLGLSAHSLNDAKEAPQLYQYYRWILEHCFPTQKPNELSAKLIGMAFVCSKIFKTDLPQPLTLNPWQVTKMTNFPLANRRAVIVENNSMFILLATRHSDWPLINQGGNDFQAAYVTLIQNLENRGVIFTYLGDLDATGIRMADTLFKLLRQTNISDFLALQTVNRVSEWVTLYGEPSARRTRQLTVTTPELRQEMNTVTLFGKYVEQEKLLDDYEKLIEEWL